MNKRRAIAAVIVGVAAWPAAYFGFHETDTIWFTGTKCAQYRVPGWPDHVRPEIERRLNELAVRYDAGDPRGSVTYGGAGFAHVCGGWRVHLRVREALAESTSPDQAGR